MVSNDDQKIANRQLTAGEDYFSALTRNQADIVLLVLESQGMQPDYINNNNKYDIIVRDTEEKASIKILEQYFSENLNSSQKTLITPLSWKSPAIFIIMAMLGLIHFYIWHQGIQWEIIKEFGSSALYIIQGEYYRAVTALFLHSDIEHLTGNLLGLFVFGTGVFSLTGYGKGSLMLLLSGFSGNITTAYFKRTLYFSIGASTTILGAAGILTALEIARQKKTSVSGIRLFAPFAAGMALLGFLSNGKNTDISAHLFGFLWGFLIGGIYIVLFNEKQNTKSENILYSIISIIIVFGAFMKKF